VSVALVVAHSANRVIGRDGGLPWHLPSDLRHFKELTTGGTVVMGRRTWDSIPERFRPLPGRRNIVVSRNGVGAPEVFAGVEAALDAAGDCFVIGGGQVYAAALPLADTIHATEVEADVEGDAFFPEPSGFTCVNRSDPIEENGHRFTFVTYARG
jgi:dihydrofolate reductase